MVAVRKDDYRFSQSVEEKFTIQLKIDGDDDDDDNNEEYHKKMDLFQTASSVRGVHVCKREEDNRQIG